jgi:hypothetical protein
LTLLIHESLRNGCFEKNTSTVAETGRIQGTQSGRIESSRGTTIVAVNNNGGNRQPEHQPCGSSGFRRTPATVPLLPPVSSLGRLSKPKLAQQSCSQPRSEEKASLFLINSSSLFSTRTNSSSPHTLTSSRSHTRTEYARHQPHLTSYPPSQQCFIRFKMATGQTVTQVTLKSSEGVSISVRKCLACHPSPRHMKLTNF